MNNENSEVENPDEIEAITEFRRQMELQDGEADKERMALREGALKMFQVFLRGMHLLRTYKGNKAMAMDCFFMAIGKGDEIGFAEAVDVSKHHFGDASKKAAITKCIKYFQDRTGIPPMPGQRSERGCKNMALTRKGQLK